MMYVKISIRGYYIDFPEELSPELYDNLGETYQDFLDNKWVKLSDKQLKFREDNPNASVQEVLNMKLNETPELSKEELTERAKSNKLRELEIYDNSPAVNEFSINEQLKTWFTPEQRSNYKNSIDSAKLLDIKTLQLLVNGQVIELPTDKAAQLLAMIQLYADACYMVTEQHKAKILALEEVNEIEEYNFTLGYPEKLNFTL